MTISKSITLLSVLVIACVFIRFTFVLSIIWLLMREWVHRKLRHAGDPKLTVY